jgi:hypothetical protein
MNTWTDNKTRRAVGAEWRGQVERPPHNPDAVIIGSGRILRPNFDKCRRDAFCRCRKCKPALK